jgi:hypothetical protein
MNTRTLTITSTVLSLACAGCIVSPPPPPAAMMIPPPAQAAPQTAQAPAQAPTCREFQQTITVGGTPQAGYGTTCQQPDGTWRVADAAQPAPSGPPAQPQVASTTAYPYYAYPYPAYYPAYAYAPGYYTYGGIYVRGRFR